MMCRQLQAVAANSLKSLMQALLQAVQAVHRKSLISMDKKMQAVFPIYYVYGGPYGAPHIREEERGYA